MATCVYDNLLTLHRELWQDGKIKLSISCEFLESLAAGANIFLGFAVDPKFKAGSTYGDPAAINLQIYPANLPNVKNLNHFIDEILGLLD